MSGQSETHTGSRNVSSTTLPRALFTRLLRGWAKGLDAVWSAPAPADVLAAIDQYNNAPAADKTTLLAKISLILSDLSQNIQTFVSDVLPSLSGNTALALVTGLISLILSTLAGFAAQLPTPPAGAVGAHAHRAARAVPAGIVIAPKVLSRKNFVKQYNALCASNGHAEISLR